MAGRVECHSAQVRLINHLPIQIHAILTRLNCAHFILTQALAPSTTTTVEQLQTQLRLQANTVSLAPYSHRSVSVLRSVFPEYLKLNADVTSSLF